VSIAEAELERPEDALHELRRTRRRNRLADVHWIDALYRVYIVGFLGVIAVALGADALPGDPVGAAEATEFARDAPAWLGLAIAAAVGIGLRSGARGGPLVLEAPVVVHELNAPVDRAAVLRAPAVKQLRFLAFCGAVVGGIAGELASQRLPVNAFALAGAGAAVFALAGMLASGAAMVVSGRHMRWWPANLLAVVLLAWSGLDILLGTTTSPLTWLASGALWPVTFTPLAIVGAVLAIVVAVLGVLGIGRLSTEHALRRASLVAQLRFAVTLQDVRTVVLLRRQLSQEKPRRTPWVRIGWGTSHNALVAVFKRDWQSYLRFPLVRLVRMVVLAAAAGVALGFAWRGTPALIIVAGVALFVAAYDAAEPVAQEVDHPTRWESYPDDPGRFLANHLFAAILVMLVLCVVTAGTAMLLVPAGVVIQLFPVVTVTVAGAAALGAIISTSQGAPNSAALVGLGPDVMGWVLIARVVLPPALVVVSLLPLLGAGSDPGAVDSARVANSNIWVFFPLVIGFLYLRTRKPKHL
jgi:hypothetical protein